MNDDYKELVEYLDDRFTKIDDSFAKVDNRFSKIEGKLDDLAENKADKSDVNNLTNAVDAYAKKADTYFQEMLVLSNRVSRLEKWMQEVADKVGIKLEF